ncbi:hypothetical protein [Levilinea saccharolytica]|uniref:Uncharacterized protein n=1 Tax=Levilinea saccharolytica TaxID=229921 RepID=A0A0P6XR73_9CHLR|nr:hypothetical protein [Levilinea saccharolytica]KPL84960.1 hypothetical protein ADN01_06095 [Levilinea saccharolytica]GAP18044.1 hypothetical protein LSAC_01928 [Levilinea saccharolytica]
MQSSVFDILLLIARPAAGKSEIIHFLTNLPKSERITRFHVGDFHQIDDFPMLWAWFEEDRLLSKMGLPRLHTDDQENFKYPYLWDLLIERICLEYQKSCRDVNTGVDVTALLEFSRGKEHGGYRSAFQHIDPAIAERMAILYVNVPWEESLRKNRRRFNPDRPDSILEHGLPDEKLERLYKEEDWTELSSSDPEWITIQNRPVPYVVFENADDVTTDRGPELASRLEDCLNRLWKLYRQPR